MTVQPTSLRSELPEKRAACAAVVLRARMQALAAVCMIATARTLSPTVSSKNSPVKYLGTSIDRSTSIALVFPV